ncbi:MAG TPA: aspartate aminotransferase family protein, partial [Acidimicrobiaceae bacterium]|nr:aspartate aminotransferase family protein [Acidimicrobiaceae bacterium]
MSTDQITEKAKQIASVEMAKLLENTTASKALFDRATRTMPGGVASSFQLGDPYPIYLSRGVGSRVWDVDGTEYFDFHNGFGSMAVGHANPRVADAVEYAARNGMHFAVTVEKCVELAEEL